MQAREDCAEWYCKKFLGSKWRMKLFEEFYTHGGKGSPIRLAHLRASLGEACLGTNAWVAAALESDVDFKKEVLDSSGICDFSVKWLERLEVEMTVIATRLAAKASRDNDKPRRVSFSKQGARTSSQVSAEGTRPSSIEDLPSTASLEDLPSTASLPDAFERLQTVA